jgi:hypothetical protein
MPMNRAKERHTNGLSRNRFSRGVSVVDPNCTTRNSSENTIPTNGITAAASENSIARTSLLSTRGPTSIAGAASPRTTATTTATSWVRPDRSPRRRCRARISVRWPTGVSATGGGRTDAHRPPP